MTSNIPHPSSIPHSTGRLAGRRILITGAASGIGRCTAQMFAAEGASLLLLDRDQDRLQETARDTGGQAFALDIGDEVAINSAVQQGASALGGLDGVVNAAGVMLRGSVGEVDAVTWRRVLDINLTGSYLVVRACLPWLEQASTASIVNIGSAQGLLPNVANRTAYAASKGGLINLTRALAAELAPRIRANCVCPGLVDTPMADGVQGNSGNYALGRLAQPEEIARVILFLTSHEASYVTGATLAADGGRSFH